MFQRAAGLGLTLLLSLLATQASAISRVQGVRLHAAPDYTRLVLDLSGPVEHDLSYLSDPERVVIDIPEAVMNISSMPKAQGVVKMIRSGISEDKVLRVVLDINQQVTPRSFVLSANHKHGDRLVVDLNLKNAPAPTLPRVRHDDERDIVVAISPGHGGRDPGAIGRRGTREKDVVLAIAKRLKAHLDANEGITGKMVRSSDRLVPYRDRMRFARANDADLFVEIHADAFTDKSAHGSTVYILSERGASSEAARVLADEQNTSAVLGGISLEDKDDDLKSVLIDLSQSASLGASSIVAKHVIAEMGKVGRVRKRKVQQAGFLVLKSPDIPSILVETAFISNPKEESRLRSPKDQDKWGAAIANGIVSYFTANPPPDTLFAARHDYERPDDLEYVVSPGDTLSGIADRFNVSLSKLRKANKIRGDNIRVDQVIRIPSSRS
jgi:N-acetylmuramoyl-L-alanine amidase